MFKSISIVSIFLFAGSALAVNSYKITITRNNVNAQKMVYASWSGEYPQPVIDVNSKVKRKKTTIQAYKSLRNLHETVSCSINNGIYHPWSQDNNKTIYYSIKAQEDYAVIKKSSIEMSSYDESSQSLKSFTYPLASGDQIQNIFYASEGICVGTHVNQVNKKKTSKEIDFSCELVDDRQTFKRLSSTASKDDAIEQWLYVSCAEGYKAFITDELLLKSPGVKEGTILEYGTVGPKN